MSDNNNTLGDAGRENVDQANVTLEARPERRLIPHAPSFRYVDYQIRVATKPPAAQIDRSPLTLALVIDRSGSMSGNKITTAKSAALAVLDKLDERDTVAVVVFDSEITTIQPAAPATSSVKQHVREELAKIEARASTALHEGWLTGCNAIVSVAEASERQSVARCFLLTDGLANVGLTDPEQIATQAAGIRKNAGIGTSTFGIGLDYAEELLGPLAVAGGGRFHHLRTASEIASTFIGELGELLATVAASARLEVEVEPGVSVKVVSMYEASANPADPTRWSIAIGDLISGEERHVVVRFDFGYALRREEQAIRARLVWTAEGAERGTDWETLRFTYADDATCEAETPDAAVVHLAGESLSDQAQREALMHSKRGDLETAHMLLAEASAGLAMAAPIDPSLSQEIDEIKRLDAELAHGPLPSARSKEEYFRKQSRSRGQRDLRS
jgi:Ca-activated chloride channel homolog